MLKLNTLLVGEGIAPEGVKLVRHHDTRYKTTPYQLLRKNLADFEFYQSIQKKPVFARAKILASFVVTPFDDTLFVGLYSIKGVSRAKAGLVDPISGKNVEGLFAYELLHLKELSDYRERLVIEWGEGYRSWVQWAKKNRNVVEIRRVSSDPPFPGFLKFRVRLSELGSVPISWRAALSSIAGVYLLVHPGNGRQYVGIAEGQGGFWARWEQYVESGHGGNKKMIEIPAADYQVSILEVSSMPVDSNTLAEMESRLKQKLLSKEFGLNAN
jgi:hypothetical protein